MEEEAFSQIGTCVYYHHGGGGMCMQQAHVETEAGTRGGVTIIRNPSAMSQYSISDS